MLMNHPRENHPKAKNSYEGDLTKSGIEATHKKKVWREKGKNLTPNNDELMRKEENSMPTNYEAYSKINKAT